MANTDKHFGYWVFGKDMTNVNLKKLKNNGVTDIFLNFYAFESHGESKVLSWIKNANSNKINVHIWVQCFYNGKWQNPKTTDLTSKLKEIKKYAGLNGVKGVHLDYLRYPGNAYKTTGGADAITNFVKKVRSQNPKTFLSCAVMPEQSDKYYYGQDIDALGKIVDAIVPMQYKGNYEANTIWLETTSKLFASKGNLWSGLQTYKSDNDTTKLSSDELINDVKTCLNNGAKGCILFRYGISPEVNFTSLQPKTNTSQNIKKSDKMAISANDIKTMAISIKNYIEKNKTFPSTITVNKTKYTYGQVAYILCYAVNNPNKSAEVFTVANAANASGDSINENIAKDDYKDIARRIASFIKSNKACPNYATTKKSKKKLRPRVFIYMMARIVAWYHNNNKTLPKYANANSAYFKGKSTATKSINQLHAYLTSQGCSGMGQCTGYYCGPNSLQQCFYRLTGIKVSESTIASVAGTTTSGTDHAGLNTAVAWFNKKYGKNIKITWKNFSDLGSNDTARWKELQNLINKGAVFVHLLYRDRWGHYEVPKSVGDSNLSILNSLGNSCGGSTYCGYIETRSKSAQRRYMNGISQKSIAILTKG